MRFQGSFDLPRGKTLCIVFIAQIEWVAKIGFLIGNDLETSEVLYLTLFCIKSKERFIVSTKILRILFICNFLVVNSITNFL